MENDMKEDRTN